MMPIGRIPRETCFEGFCQHEEVSVRVLDKDSALAVLLVAGLPPDVSWSAIDGPVSLENRPQALEIDLDHRSLAERILGLACGAVIYSVEEHRVGWALAAGDTQWR